MRRRTPEREIARAIRHYRRLLDRSAPEEQVQEFLEEHLYFWNGLIRGDTPCPLYAKVRLGSEFVADFAYFEATSDGPEWFLIEIERPGVGPLFLKNGDPSSKLMHAIHQVENWQEWVARNLSYAQGLMPQIDRPFGRIFFGRRSELESEAARARLRALNRRYRGHLEVRTLDSFLDGAHSAMSTGERFSIVPRRALTHSDLCNGLPESARHFLQHPIGGSMRDFVEARLVPPRYPWPEEDAIEEEVGNSSIVNLGYRQEAREAHQRRLRLASEAGRMELVFDDNVVWTMQREPGISYGSFCTFRLRLYEGYETRPVAIASQLIFDGLSLTNEAERLCAAVWKKFFRDEKRPPLWVQNYPEAGVDSEFLGNEWEFVEFEAHPGYGLDSVSWHPASREEVERLVGQDVSPYRDDVFQIPRRYFGSLAALFGVQDQ
jgi:hypothetical protein